MRTLYLNLLVFSVFISFGASGFAAETETCEDANGHCEISMTAHSIGGTCFCKNQSTVTMVDGELDEDASTGFEFTITEFCDGILVYACQGDESTVDEAVLANVADWMPKPSNNDDSADAAESKCSVSSGGVGRFDSNLSLLHILFTLLN